MNKNFLVFLTLFAANFSHFFAQPPSMEWAKGIGGTSDDQGNCIKVDAQGAVYTVGRFRNTADFDPGPGVYNLTSAGLDDAFVSKLDSAGNFVWAVKLGGSSNEFAYGIAIDQTGGVIIVGNFGTVADFDPGPATYSLTATDNDAFIWKLNSNGGFVWAKQVAGASHQYAHDISIAGDHTILVSGIFTGTADFDPGPGTYSLTPMGAYLDTYVLKLDSLGDFVWVRNLGGLGAEWGYSVKVDGSGNVYTSGWFDGTADFDPGSGTSFLTSAGNQDVFLSKLDANGNFVWARKFGGMPWEECLMSALDATGNIYVPITLMDSTTIGPFHFVSHGSSDIAIVKVDPAGNILWAKSIGGANTDRVYSIAVDDAGDVYYSGHFVGTSDFDPGIGTFNLTSASPQTPDIFISKLDQAGNFVWAVSAGGYGIDRGRSVATNRSDKVYLTGWFESIADLDPGPGIHNVTAVGTWDFFVLQLSQCQNTSSQQFETACNSYTWLVNGQTYAVSGIHSATIPNLAGCDSVITLDLTINESSSVTLDTTACNSFMLNSQFYTSSGTFTQMLTNAAGCDSAITLNLTINVADTSISIVGNTLTANATGAAYHWLDCSNSLAPIIGAVNQTFTPISTGSYAVVVIQNGCTDTSSCANVTIVGLDHGANPGGISIFPVPTRGSLTIDRGQPKDQTEVIIFDTQGREILKKSAGRERFLHLDIEGSSGLYLLQITEHNQPPTFHRVLLQ